MSVTSLPCILNRCICFLKLLAKVCMVSGAASVACLEVMDSVLSLRFLLLELELALLGLRNPVRGLHKPVFRQNP